MPITIPLLLAFAVSLCTYKTLLAANDHFLQLAFLSILVPNFNTGKTTPGDDYLPKLGGGKPRPPGGG